MKGGIWKVLVKGEQKIFSYLRDDKVQKDAVLFRMTDPVIQVLHVPHQT